ncbi:MAG: 23S rRNA (uracil(1939)-C(5))-methyltransferase RlmD, partial [Clostridia bacterium]|nr:23S rRNA (uracil(1939)-C(5))-methyltransferase RlmD [Clostridia bacterium]
LGAEKNRVVLETVLSFTREFSVEPYDENAHTGVVRHVLIREGRRTGELMVCVVINAKKLKGAEELCRRLKERLPELRSFTLCVNREKTNVIMGGQIINIYGPGYIEEEICETGAELSDGGYTYHEMPVKPVRFRISPLSFFQVNSRQMERLYGTALEFAGLTGQENVWDLYCGVGTISLFLSRHAKKVYGVEIIPAAIENARENAALNGIENAEFFVGKAEEVLPRWYEEQYQKTGEKIDVIVVDPPRKGCDILCLETMVSISPDRIVYVSCDPATLARDLKYLSANGYRVEKVRPCDMFGHTVHVETVCLLSKLSGAKNHISVKVEMDEMDLTAAESKATYQEIQDWVQEKYGFHVTHLNIAKTKRKCGIIERQNFNLPKSDDSRSPETQKDKEEAIIEAFRHFQMI